MALGEYEQTIVAQRARDAWIATMDAQIVTSNMLYDELDKLEREYEKLAQYICRSGTQCERTYETAGQLLASIESGRVYTRNAGRAEKLKIELDALCAEHAHELAQFGATILELCGRYERIPDTHRAFHLAESTKRAIHEARTARSCVY